MSTMRAYYMDSSPADQREPHELTPSQPVSREHLAKLGVLYWYLPSAAENPDASEELSQIRKERGYTYVDFITVSADRLPNYEQKIKTFFEEHLHTDEEIRFIMDGTGYFDVRDVDDRWIRIAMGKGDMIVLPKGMYHRFTLDTSNYLKAMRLFVGDPVWTPWNRVDPATEAMKERAEYVGAFVAAA